MSQPGPTVSVIVLPPHDGLTTASLPDGVLQQRIDFAVEIVMAVDDDSPVREQLSAANISRQHAIRLLEIPSETAPGQFLSAALRACSGRYVAVTADDVRWTSDDRLRKQIDQLERHPSWVMCCHRVRQEDTVGSCLPEVIPEGSSSSLTLEDLIRSDTIARASAVVRRDVLPELPGWLASLSVDATWGWLLLHAARGDVGCLQETLASITVPGGDAAASVGRVSRIKRDNLILRRLRHRLTGSSHRTVTRQLSDNHARLAEEMDLQIRETSAFRHRRLSFLYGGWQSKLPVKTRISQALHTYSGVHAVAARGYEQAMRLGNSSRFLRFLVRTLVHQPSWLVRLGGALLRGGVSGLRREWRVLHYLFGISSEEYRRWIRQYDTLNEADRTAIRRRISAMPSRPRISVIVPVYNTPEAILRQALDSVVRQLYQDWELCVADDASESPHVRQVLTEYQQADPRIRCCFRDERGNISAASNSALEMADGDLVTFLDHDDELAEQALYMVAEEFLRHPDADLIYSDEDRLGSDGRRESPYFKTDWNPDLMLAQNMVCHLAAYRRELLLKIGGLRMGVEGSQDHDLVLRFSEQTSADRIRHIPAILYHWRRTPGSVSSDAVSGVASYQAGVRAVQDHLDRRGVQATVSVVTERGSPHYRVRYALPTPVPSVSVVVPTRDRVELLRRCVDGVLNGTNYPDLELIIVDNNSSDAAALAYLADLEQQPRVQVLREAGAFNYSALNNRAVQAADGEFVCLLNNDIEVIHSDWLSEMVSQAVQPGVGAVGARLLYPDDCIQHAGVMIGWGGGAGHAFSGLPKTAPVPFSRLDAVQTLSCVTAACMVLKKSVYDEMQGLEERAFAVAYNDVDLCLRLSEAGYRIVWTPCATLYHHESASRGRHRSQADQVRDRKEGLALRERWQQRIASDPYLNPNVSIEIPDYRPAFPPRVRRPWQGWQAESRDVGEIGL